MSSIEFADILNRAGDFIKMHLLRQIRSIFPARTAKIIYNQQNTHLINLNYINVVYLSLKYLFARSGWKYYQSLKRIDGQQA